MYQAKHLLCTVSVNLPNKPESCVFIISILHMGKLRPEEVESFLQ